MSEIEQARKDVQEALIKLATLSVKDALSLLLGNLVGISAEMIRRNGHDADKEIKFENPGHRTVTINERTE